MVERHIGRKLESYEHVHHKDGDQHNNNIANLEVLSAREHAHKRVMSKNDWAIKIKEMVEEHKNRKEEILDQSLSVFFTVRQKQILYRKYFGLPLSKTEGEVFSRVIKKRIRALANKGIVEYAFNILH